MRLFACFSFAAALMITTAEAQTPVHVPPAKAKCPSDALVWVNT
jgi:hypothetical protein